MAMSKGKVLCLCVFMFLGVFACDTNAKTIGYGVIQRGTIPCDPLNRFNCNGHTPANPYTRGCERETDCRSGGN